MLFHPVIAIKIETQRIADDSIKTHILLFRVRHGAMMQGTSGIHGETALQRRIGLAALCLAEFQIIIRPKKSS